MEGEEAAQLTRRLRQELAVGGEDLGARLDGPERRAADHGVDRVEAEHERGDDAEVAAAATDRPEQIRLLVGARTDLLAAGEHHLRLEQVVDREAVVPGQVADAAAEGEASDSGRRDDPARRRQAVLVGRVVDLAPGATAADPNRAGLGIDIDRLEQREVDDDAVVTRPQSGAVVAAAAHGQQQVVRGGEANRRCDVVGVGAARDQRRTLLDHRVVDLARLAVVGVIGADQLAPEPGELVVGGLCGCGGGHASPRGHLMISLSAIRLGAGTAAVMTRTDPLLRPARTTARSRMVRPDYRVS